MLLPLIYSHGDIYHNGYWRYYLPSFLIASFFGACAFSGIRCVVVLLFRDRNNVDEG